MGTSALIRLVHLSDIHFGGYGGGWDRNEDQRSELLLDLRRLVGAGGPVDGVLVGGDIAFRASEAEYDDASAWLQAVCDEGQCHYSRVWVVPGNHDIDRDQHRNSRARQAFIQDVRAVELDGVDRVLSEWLASDPAADGMFAPLTAYNRFAAEFGCSTSPRVPHWSDPTLELDGLVVHFTGLNTVIASDTEDWQDGPTLVIGRHQCELPRDQGQIHIAFGHHPPHWLRDWPTVEPYLRRAQLLLFGHEHKYRATRLDADGPVVVFAGAVGPHDGGDQYVPSWNLLTLERVGSSLRVTIDPRVWIPEDTRFGPHTEGISRFTMALEVSDGAEAPRDDGPADETPGAPATPLVPTVNESADALPNADDRARYRRIAVAFMRLAPSRWLDLARDLGVEEGLAEAGLPSFELGREVLTRIRLADKIDELMEKLDNA